MLKILRIIPKVAAGSRQLHALSKACTAVSRKIKFFQWYAPRLCSSLTSPNGKPLLSKNLSESDIALICEEDTELEKLLRVIILEVDILRQDGHLVPDNIELDDWRELLMLRSRSARIRYLTFLFKNEKRNENKQRKAEEKRREREEADKVVEETNHIKYGFGGCTIFIRVYDSTIDTYMNKKLMNAAIFSQHIVFDCSYDKHMTRLEQRNCAKQICILFAENRNHPEPFHLQFCNVDSNSYMPQFLNRYIPPMYEPHYPMFLSPKSYLDMYDKERLVYLTPHCRQELLEWNHDDVYIVGAMVDKSNPKPLSLAKAKQEGLRMARLPLERHLVWGSGSSKNLTLNQMTRILLDVRQTGDWAHAFQHIPKRKVVDDSDLDDDVSESTYKMRINQSSRKMNPGDVLLSSNIIKKVKKQKASVDFNKLYD